MFSATTHDSDSALHSNKRALHRCRNKHRKQEVRSWLKDLGLPQYADKLMKRGYDDLQFLQMKANLDAFVGECYKLKIPPAHIDRIIEAIEVVRHPPIRT